MKELAIELNSENKKTPKAGHDYSNQETLPKEDTEERSEL